MRGEVVLITGGSSGIGLAAARRFAAEGARVWITARDPDRLAAAAAQIPGTVRFHAADVTDTSSIESLVDTLRDAEGSIDVLVNSAGQLGLAPGEKSLEMAERLLRVNYLGPAKVIAAALPLVRAGRRRSIVNLSSIVGKLTPPFWSAYAASKYALQSYSNALRQELRPEKIHVGIVMPGPVRSPMTEDLLRTPMYPVPIGIPVVTPDRVAEAILGCVFHRRAEVSVPRRLGPIMRLAAAFPRLVDLVYLPYRGRVE